MRKITKIKFKLLVKKLLNHKLMLRWVKHHNLRLQLLAFMLMFGVVGLIFLSITRAATPTILPSTLATLPGHVGQQYQISLALSNGSSATWSISGGSLPDGLSLNNNQIAGLPQQAGSFIFTVKATSNSVIYTKDLTIFIRPKTITGYDNRLNIIINRHFSNPWPKITGCSDHIGYLNYGTAALWLNQDTTHANDLLSQVRLDRIYSASCSTDEPPSRANLWLNYLVRPYMLFNVKSSYFPGRLSTEAADNLAAQMWAYAKNYSKITDTNDVWSIYDSENHNSQSKSFFFISAQILKNRPDYQNRTYSDGSTPQQQYQAWHNYWSTYLDERAKKGLFIEAGSPTYHGYTLQGLLNIYNFAEDPVLRKKAEIVLDLDFADYAQNQLKNIWGGGKSRSYPDDSYNGAGDAMKPLGDLLFGPANPSANNHTLFLATSGYYPPEVVRTLATDPTSRGTYEYVTRRPGTGPADWDSKLNYHVNTTKSVLHYSFVTPDYILGSALLKPGETYTKISGQNRWQGIIFNTTPQDRVYPLAAPPTMDRTFDSWYSVQKKHTLLMRKNGDLDKNSYVYFAAGLDNIDEENGWLFVQEGSAFLAVRPANGSYSWLTSSKNQATDQTQRYIKLTDAASPIIFDAARTNEYSSFTAFKSAIKNNLRSYTNGILTYTNAEEDVLSLATSGNTIPTVNNQPVNYAPSKVLNSPFMSSDWNSGIISISKNGLSANYNLTDSNAPQKSVVSDITPPSVPQNLVAYSITAFKVIIAWQASSDNEGGISQYKVYRKTGNSNFIQIATTTALNYQDASVTGGQTYTYGVSAVDDSGNESPKSNSLDVDVPVVVTFDVADLDNNGKVELPDFYILKSKFGLTSKLGKADMDGNGKVDLIDFGIFVERYRVVNG